MDGETMGGGERELDVEKQVEMMAHPHNSHLQPYRDPLILLD